MNENRVNFRHEKNEKKRRKKTYPTINITPKFWKKVDQRNTFFRYLR